jgi:hypothetical protein
MFDATARPRARKRRARERSRAGPDWTEPEPIRNRRGLRPEADGVEGANVHMLCAFVRLFQINPKLFKIQPSPATPAKENQRKKAWISLDSLGGNEPFQGVIVTPRGKKSCLAPFPLN